ncbi:zinc finger associated protein [Popillia japonica]|uniref:Zinc finger associated protein n=1 Tax=Popillia japonica TaxID=7064 RepID=A0AAW1JVZ9_POPJA
MSGPASQIANYSRTPIPVSPRRGALFEHVSDAGDVDMNDSLTPVTQPGLSSLDYGELSDGEILKHIRLLQQILDKRAAKKSSNRNLHTDFKSEGATNFHTGAWVPTTRVQNPSPPEEDASSPNWANSLVRTFLSGSETLSNRKRQASSPNRISVEAMVHSLPSGAPNQIITSCGAQPFSPKRQRTATVDLADLNRNEHAYASQAEQGGKRKFPPIVLRDKSIWFRVSNEINHKGFSFTKAQNVANGISLFPTSEADFRGIAKFFTTDNIPFHTYQLPSEKVLNVVLRNIPVEIPDDQIKKQLEELGFKPDSVVRMRRNHGGRPMPLVLVKISKDQRRIYHLEKFMSLDTSVETLKAKPSIGQCFRCQRFGHAQSRCTAQ